MDEGGYVEVLPVNAGYICVPTYDPFIVYAPPRPGFFIGGAIGFGAGFLHRRKLRRVGLGRRVRLACSQRFRPQRGVGTHLGEPRRLCP